MLVLVEDQGSMYAIGFGVERVRWKSWKLADLHEVAVDIPTPTSVKATSLSFHGRFNIPSFIMDVVAHDVK